MKKADLHIHSYYSTGKLSPKEIVAEAAKRGISFLSITDYNSISGLEEAIKESTNLQVHLIPGIEIPAVPADILAYLIDFKSEQLKTEIDKIGKLFEDEIREQLEFLDRIDVHVQFEDLRKMYPHSTHYHRLQLKGLLQTKYPEDAERYYKISRQEIVHRKPSTDIIELVLRYGGVPVLAHPWLQNYLFDESTIQTLVNAGLKGIEFDNGDRSRRGRDLPVRRKILEYAKNYGLIITLGSDFREFTRDPIDGHNLGKTYCTERTVEKLWNARKQNNG